jgi:long-chain acyl-CoA synthetase
MSKNQWLAEYPEGYTHDLDIPNISLADFLKDSAKQFPEKKAVRFYDYTLSYQELYQSAVAFAAALQKKGVQKGDRVAVMLPNCPQYVISYYGILLAGGIVTQVNPMLVERELQYLLRDSGSESIILLDALYPKLKSVQDKTNIQNVITVSLQQEFSPSEPDSSFKQFLSNPDPVFTPVNIDPKNDIAVLQYTGGTTGRSKGAMLTHRNLVSNVIQTFEFFKNDFVPGEETCLSVIPFFHVFGMTSCMNLSIYAGNTILLLPRFDIEEVLSTIKTEQPTVFPGVPTMYVALTNHPKAEEYGINSIKTCNSGSAPMPVELLKEFERKTNSKILEGYGLSEASPTTHCNPPFADRKPGTVGIGFPGTEYKVVDVATGAEEVETNQLGELIIKGPQVMKGYWNNLEETANTLRDGWLYTGDIAKVDEKGYVSIVDRKKDMIIASGYNIYPRDIEEVLYEHPAVQEAVVIGIPDSYRGETVKAYIVLKEGKNATEEEITKFCKERLSPYKVPKIIEYREELPKTNVGKILRRALREEVKK